MTEALQRLLRGFQEFRAQYFNVDSELYKRLVERGQAPRVLVIACSDSRVDPAILTQAEPGELFIVRNVAAIVPPYENDAHIKGTSSAIEFAVRGLEVEHILVLGHGLCGGVQLLSDPISVTRERFEFLADWVRVMEPARRAIMMLLADKPAAERLRALELCSIVSSLRNLLGFPWIAERIASGKLALHGWYFDLVDGQLWSFDPRQRQFVRLDASSLLDQGVAADTWLPDALDLETFAINARTIDCVDHGGLFGCRCRVEEAIDRAQPTAAASGQR